MKAHQTVIPSVPKVFNHQNIWSSMNDYYGILDGVGQSHWARALNFDDHDNTESHADESLLSAYRANFFVPSSPMKP